MAPFCSMLVACKLENGIALVEQTPATTESILRIRLPKKYLANSATYRRRAGRPGQDSARGRPPTPRRGRPIGSATRRLLRPGRRGRALVQTLKRGVSCTRGE